MSTSTSVETDDRSSFMSCESLEPPALTYMHEEGTYTKPCTYSTHYMYVSILGNDQTQETPSNTQSIGIQCNLLAAPPLCKLPKECSEKTGLTEPSNRSEPPNSDTEDTDDVAGDLDTSFHITQDDIVTE